MTGSPCCLSLQKAWGQTPLAFLLALLQAYPSCKQPWAGWPFQHRLLVKHSCTWGGAHKGKMVSKVVGSQT
jgi:hypothetical protein